MDETLSALWRASWQGGVAIVAVSFLCRFFPKTPPALTCWLWRLVYLKFLLTLALAPLPPLTLPLLPASAVIASAPITDVPHIAPLPSPRTINRQPAAPKLLSASEESRDWRIGVLTLYFAGVVVAMSQAIWAIFAVWRLVHAAILEDSDAVRKVAAELAAALSLRRVPRLVRTGKTDSPLLAFGTILLPESTPVDTLRLMLAHELAHVRRRDLAWEWLGTLTQILFWFHPLVLLARREERLARESAADALALQITNAPAVEYGQLLLSLSVGPRRLPPLVGAVGAVETGTALRRRLTALGASPELRLGNRLRGAVVALGLVALLSLIPWRLIRAEAQPSASAPALVASEEPPAPSGKAELIATITAMDGTPRANALINLSKFVKTPEGYLTIQQAGTATTDAKGRLSFGSLEPGEYFVLVEAPKGKREPSLTFHIKLNEKGLTLDLRIPPVAFVQGRLTFRGTGKPVVGARMLGDLSLMQGKDLEDRQLALQSHDDTDKEGRYSLPLAAGKTEVTVSSVGYNGSSVQYLEEQKATVIVRAGQTATRNFTALPAAALKFADLQGNPVAGVSVSVQQEDLTARVAHRFARTTATDGLIILLSFSSGTFRAQKGALSANGTFKRDAETGALAFRTETQKGTAADGRTTIFLSETPSATLTGRVADEDGKPIPNARIKLSEIDPKSKVSRRDPVSTADADGRFSLALALDGEYSLYVRAAGYNQVDVLGGKGFTPTRGETKDVGTVTLHKAEGTVSGQVVDEEGKPVERALAFVRGDMTFVSAAVTDAEGRFRIPNVVKEEELELTICRVGEARDSGEGLSQSNDYWYRQGVKASDKPLKIVLRKNQMGLRLSADSQ